MTNTIILVISIVLLLDSLFVLVFPKTTRNMLKAMLKNGNLKKIAIWEMIIALILLLVSFMF